MLVTKKSISLLLLLLVIPGSKSLLYTLFGYMLSSITDESSVVALALPITAGTVVLVSFFPFLRIWGLYGTFAGAYQNAEVFQVSDGLLKPVVKDNY